jgi:hypothetical protein
MVIYRRCRELLEEWGISDTDCTMVLFGMADGNIGYREALKMFAEHRGVSVEIMHSRICYALLAAHVDIRPEMLFDFLIWKGGQAGAH